MESHLPFVTVSMLIFNNYVPFDIALCDSAQTCTCRWRENDSKKMDVEFMNFQRGLGNYGRDDSFIDEEKYFFLPFCAGNQGVTYFSLNFADSQVVFLTESNLHNLSVCEIEYKLISQLFRILYVRVDMNNSLQKDNMLHFLAN